MKERFCLDIGTDFMKRTLDDALETVKAAGFPMVFLSGTETPGFPKDEVIFNFADKAAKHGLKAVNYHLDFRNSDRLWLDCPERAELISQYLRLIRCCAAAGMSSVVIHPTSGVNNLYVSRLGLDAFLRLTEEAERSGITVCVENLRTFVQNDFLLSNIHSERFGFCHDCGHEFAYMKGMEFPRRYASRLCFTHLHDNDGIGDLHQLPFDGELDWKHLSELYREVGYAGPLSLEVTLKYGIDYKMSFEDFVREAYRRMVRIFGE